MTDDTGFMTWLDDQVQADPEAKAAYEDELNRLQSIKATRSAIQASIRKLSTFRTQCLLGEGPASITVDGFKFHNELEAEGYLAELGAALKELEDE